MKKFNKKDYLVFCGSIVLVIVAISYQQDFQAKNQVYFPRPLSEEDVKIYSNTDPKAVVIYPIFTQFAYGKNGFYDYYNGTCKTCNVISMNPLQINSSYVVGKNSFDNLSQLHYPFITDVMVDKHPEILNEYDKVILLHNEYMTKTEFNAIKNHKHILYLYPNSAYVEVSVDYTNMTITLVKGHGYPQSNIANGFGYVTNSKNEYDLNCQNYKWEIMPNGLEPTCWPEFLIKSDRALLQIIKEFPAKLPPLISKPHSEINVSNMGYCNQYGYCPPKP